MERTFTDIQLLTGLALVALLAVAGGQARFIRVQRLLGIEQLLASGFLFLPLGMLLSEAGMGLVTRDVVRQFDALITLGLGILGLLAGLRLDTRRLDETAKRLMATAGLSVLITAVLVGIPIFFLLEMVGALSVAERATAAALLGCAAAISSGSSLLRASKAESANPGPVLRVADFSVVAGVLAAGVLLALLTPTSVGPLERLLAMAVIGSVGGIATWMLAHDTRNQALRTCLLVGMVLVTAGTASHLHLPPVAATLLAGWVIANLPGTLARELRKNLMFLEPPLRVLLLVIAGAALRVPSLGALAILGLYLVLRTAATIIGGDVASRISGGRVPRSLGLALLPSSAVALGLALDFHTGTRGQIAETVLTVAILGSLFSETAGVWTTRLVSRTLSSGELERASEALARGDFSGTGGKPGGGGSDPGPSGSSSGGNTPPPLTNPGGAGPATGSGMNGPNSSPPSGPHNYPQRSKPGATWESRS